MPGNEPPVAAAAVPLTGIAPPPPLDLKTNIVDNWKTWRQMWCNYAIVAKLQAQDEPYRIALFLHAVGADALKVYNAFVFSEGEDKDKLEDIIKKFDHHVIGEVNETYERYVFNKRDQQEGETVDGYVTALRTLAKTCSFCDCMHNSLIRDRIVLGISDQKTRERLLRERKLTINKCIDMCKSAEAASARLKHMSTDHAEGLDNSDVSVNKVRPNQKPQRSSVQHKEGSQSNYAEKGARSRRGQCRFCGYEHPLIKEKCPAFGQMCNSCGGRNHFAAKCMSGKGARTRKVHAVGRLEESKYSDVEEIGCVQIQCVNGTARNGKEIYAEMEIDGMPVKFQVDCGASVNLLPAKYCGNRPLVPYNKTLVMWNKTQMIPRGSCAVTMKNPLNGKKYRADFVVVKDDLIPLLGSKAAQAMSMITVNDECFKRVMAVGCEDRQTTPQQQVEHNGPMVTKPFKPNIPNQDNLMEIMAEYGDVFDSKLGKLPGKVHLQVDDTVSPVAVPSRRVAVSVKAKLKTELTRLVDNNVLVWVEDPTDWCSQMVHTEKKNGDPRICIDSRGLNKALKRERYQIPTLDEMLPDLAKAKVFSKLDVASAYWHLELDEESSLLTTFGTPFGRLRWKRLPFGLSVSSEIFQKRLIQALERLDGVRCIADDITVFGVGETKAAADRNHDENLVRLLQRCRERGIKLNRNKIQLRCSEIPMFGNVLTDRGLKPDPYKIEAIMKLPAPTDVEGVRRFSGFVNYLSKFLPKLSAVMVPIRQLTQNVAWSWGKPQQEAFDEVKELITRAPVLAYYDPGAPLSIECDASLKGLGATLSQNGRPVAYTSRALTEVESRYAQIEKEMLSVVYALEKFHQYTYGRHTVVYNDHKPLEAIIRKPLVHAPKRLQGMLLRTQYYDVELIYRKGRDMHLSDMLSRAYLPRQGNEQMEFERVNMVAYLPIRGERLDEIRTQTSGDETMQMLTRIILKGWPDTKDGLPEQLTPYFSARDEFSVQDGLVFKGERVVIPVELRGDMKKRIHTSHIGIEGCLRRARECLFWPGMSSDIRHYISTCETCRTFETRQSQETLMSHDLPSHAWQKVGVDLFEWDAKDFLITVDYYSNFWEVDRLYDTKSSTVIKKLKAHFARYGCPEQVVSDNGPQFSSGEFMLFSKSWDFEHLTSSPGHPQANGKAESAVKSVKGLLRKSKAAGADQYQALLDYRNTPTQGMNSSPSQRFLNRRGRTLLPMARSLLLPRTVDKNVHDADAHGLRKRQSKQEENYNKSARDLANLEEGDVVRMQPLVQGQRAWKKAVVNKRLDERSYEVATRDRVYRRNRVHLRKTSELNPESQWSCNQDHSASIPSAPGSVAMPTDVDECQSTSSIPQSSPLTSTPHAADIACGPHESPVHPRSGGQKVPVITRSGRVTRPPAFLTDYVK